MPRPTTGPHSIQTDGQPVLVNSLSKPIRPVWISVMSGRALTEPSIDSVEVMTNLTAEDINRRSKTSGTVYFKHADHVRGWALNIAEKQHRRTGTSG